MVSKKRWFGGTFKGLGIVFSILIFTLSCTQGEKEADIPNSSFEKLEKGEPVGWEDREWRPEAEFKVDTLAHKGRRSVMIFSEEGGDAAWSTVVVVKPFSRYRLTGWIKTQDVKALTGM